MPVCGDSYSDTAGALDVCIILTTACAASISGPSTYSRTWRWVLAEGKLVQWWSANGCGYLPHTQNDDLGPPIGGNMFASAFAMHCLP